MPDAVGAFETQARFCGPALDAQQTGFAHHRIKPGKRQAFGYHHVDAEEVYVVFAEVELAPRDALRVAPAVTRCFEAGADGLELVVFGQRHPGDGELSHGWWGHESRAS